jgi:hypothetical protein
LKERALFEDAGKLESKKGLMKRIVTLAAVGIALMLPGVAAAASSSTCQAYNPQLCTVTPNTTTTSSSAGTLPFTGLDVALLAIGGGTLCAAGLVVRRLSRRLD